MYKKNKDDALIKQNICCKVNHICIKNVQRSFSLNSWAWSPHLAGKRTSCDQKFHVSNECMFCAETTSDADNCLKRSQRSKQANKQQSFIDPSVKSDFIFRVMIHNKTLCRDSVARSRSGNTTAVPRGWVDTVRKTQDGRIFRLRHLPF